MNDPIIPSVGDWIEKGKPKNTWFYMVRHQDKTKYDVNLLISLIQKQLKLYGNYELREPEQPMGDCFRVEKYLIFETVGNVNGEIIPVIALYAEARITDEP